MSDHSYRHTSSTPGWVGGAILIMIGGFFLLRNLTGFDLHNWWALFILIPAFSSFARAYDSYRNQGRFSADVRGAMIAGFALTMLSAVFLFSLNFGAMWPLFLILGGVALLANALLPG